MNILVPERYSHDILRGELEGVDVTIQLLRLASRKNDLEEMQHLVEELTEKCKDFKVAFEHHDAEMQFVDKLVEEHKHQEMVNKNWAEKFRTIQRVGMVAGAIISVVAVYMLFA